MPGPSSVTVDVGESVVGEGAGRERAGVRPGPWQRAAVAHLLQAPPQQLRAGADQPQRRVRTPLGHGAVGDPADPVLGRRRRAARDDRGERRPVAGSRGQTAGGVLPDRIADHEPGVERGVVDVVGQGDARVQQLGDRPFLVVQQHEDRGRRDQHDHATNAAACIPSRRAARRTRTDSALSRGTAQPRPSR
jgi:hypothetical protein